MSIEQKPIQVLLIEDEADYAAIIERKISLYDRRFQLYWADRLSTGMDQLLQRKFDLVLLDLDLPDSASLDTLQATLTTMISCSPQTAVIILTSNTDEKVVLQAMKYGAQDFLYKPTIESTQLGRAMRFAVERMRATTALASALHLSVQALNAQQSTPSTSQTVNQFDHWVAQGLSTLVEQARLQGWRLQVHTEGLSQSNASFSTHCQILEALGRIVSLFTANANERNHLKDVTISVVYTAEFAYVIFNETAGLGLSEAQFVAEYAPALQQLRQELALHGITCHVRFLPTQMLDISWQMPIQNAARTSQS